MVLPAPGGPSTMCTPPRGKPPRSTVSRPGTPVFSRDGAEADSVVMALQSAWQANDERRPLAGRALHLDGASQGTTVLANNPEPDAKAARIAPLSCSFKALENAFQISWGNPYAVVADLQLGPLVVGARRDLYGQLGS